jgi:hypothetical protein
MIDTQTLGPRHWAHWTLMFMALSIGGPLSRVLSFATMMMVLTGAERAGDHG